MTLKKLIGFSLVAMFALSTITMTSCAKKKGCTNKKSDNYDSEAEEDDGNCKPWSEKFLGEYDVQLACASPAFAGLNSPFTMTITKNADDKIGILLNTAALGTIPLTAVISGDSFIFDQLDVAELGALKGLHINGNAKIGSDKNLSGLISIVVDTPALTDSCPMTATRK